MVQNDLRIKDIIEAPHWIQRRYHGYWEFLLQSYEGGIDYSNSRVLHQQQYGAPFDSMWNLYVNGQPQNTQIIYGNLFMHSKERADDYNKRVGMSYYYNFCAPIIDIYSDHLFKQAVVEKWGSIESTIKIVTDDIDRMGTSIQDFRKIIADYAQVYGHCFVIVDSPNVSKTKQIITRLDQIENRAFPYLTIFAPQNILNWALDEFGFPYWVLVRECADANDDPLQFDKDVNEKIQYRVWTRTDWKLYDDDYDLIDSGTHNLGQVPIVCIYDKKSKRQRNFLGISQIADIAFIARDIYNSSSELRQILRDQTFAFLALQGDSEAYAGLDLGTGKGLLYPIGSAKPEYVSPQSSNATSYFDHIDRQIIKIFQLAKVDAGAGVSGQSKMLPAGTGTSDTQSGVAKAWSFNQTNSSLSAKASNFEEGELRIWQIFAAWEGKVFDGSIQYPNEFSVKDIMDDISEAEAEAQLSLGKTFNIEVKSAIIKKKFPRADDQEIAKMVAEVTALEEKASQQPSPIDIPGQAMSFAQRMKQVAAGGADPNAGASGAGGKKTPIPSGAVK